MKFQVEKCRKRKLDADTDNHFYFLNERSLLTWLHSRNRSQWSFFCCFRSHKEKLDMMLIIGLSLSFKKAHFDECKKISHHAIKILHFDNLFFNRNREKWQGEVWWKVKLRKNMSNSIYHFEMHDSILENVIFHPQIQFENFSSDRMVGGERKRARKFFPCIFMQLFFHHVTFTKVILPTEKKEFQCFFSCCYHDEIKEWCATHKIEALQSSLPKANEWCMEFSNLSSKLLNFWWYL